MRLALFGGIYNNYLALDAALRDVRSRGADEVFCLGDLGAFGPFPDRVFPLLFENNVRCVQGNYDHSIGHALDDCQCGYTDPRDNYFAQISYDYTLAHTSDAHRDWLRTLPAEIRLDVEGRNLLLCHGSPRKTNEFLWESTTSTHFLRWLADHYQADVIFATHTGIKWQRAIDGHRHFVNVGTLGRPENDGTTNVWYSVIDCEKKSLRVEFIPVAYDHLRLANEMRSEGLPAEFIETVTGGWWTTCLESLPSKERRRGRY